MIRLSGFLKIVLVLTADFFAVYTLSSDLAIALIVTAVIALYVCLGGYISLFREGAVRSDKLPSYERSLLENAKTQLVEDVKSISSKNISGLKFYLIRCDDEMQATAYGANCVSVSQGILDNADPMTLNSVLAHEISHTLNGDSEFSRAVFATILMICGAISIVSFALVAAIFLIFLVCSFFRSFLGVMAFKGTTKAVNGVFRLFQKSIVFIYRAVAGCVSRAAEYRSDMYSAQLGYGLQLAHFLSYAAPESHRQLTLTEALYRTHPATSKRIARLENYISNGIL